MDRFLGDHAVQRAGLGPHGHPLPDQYLGVPAADGLNVKKPVFVDVLHDQPDLVAVSGQHDTQRGVAGFFRHNHVAVQVGADLVGERGDVIADDLLQGALIAGRAGSGQNCLEEIEGLGFLFWLLEL